MRKHNRLATFSKANKRRRSRLKQERRCVSCASKLPLDETRLNCELCRKKQAGYFARRNRTEANKQERERRRRRVEAGGCSYCTAKAVAGCLCLKHWFWNKASVSVNNEVSREQLERLWEKQGGRCFYTGQKLIPGRNASLDHKLPRSRGGSDDIRNLQWVLKAVNRAKTDLTHGEFVALCRAVVKRCSR
jgi:CRISPR/Cas system Type II protein with McrA/HNH and RuvC-like nuclease domain